MSQFSLSHGVQAIRQTALPLTGDPEDFSQLLELVQDATFVMLGEASHGTHEFYRIRGEITKRLIQEKGFTAVAVEADWPDAYQVNRYVRGVGGSSTAIDALSGFTRFPTWMWRNADVLNFIGWLRDHNDAVKDPHQRVGFYGLDLYSLYASIASVVAYLDKVDPDAAREARARYECFSPFGQDCQAYGYAAGLGLSKNCEDEVVSQLIDLRRHSAEYAGRDGRVAEDDQFFAEQNARIVKNAEAYYRAMFRGAAVSWNLRDRHMVETLKTLRAHLTRHEKPPKIVVWAHNSHIGDASHTQMGQQGEVNIGQLVRESFPAETRLVGFTTCSGTVTAASDWDGVAERKHVRPALEGSVEALFHETGRGNFFLNLVQPSPAREVLHQALLERAIGVIYRPQSERASHYFYARPAAQFDAIFHYDHTKAVEPLERTQLWESGEVPETYPSAL